MRALLRRARPNLWVPVLGAATAEPRAQGPPVRDRCLADSRGRAAIGDRFARLAAQLESEAFGYAAIATRAPKATLSRAAGFGDDLP